MIANINSHRFDNNKTSQAIKKTFLNYFKKHNHIEVPSSSLIGDSSLMFTNAGMVQFKDYFTGKKKPNNLNVVSSQNCIRAGGKHNDLENVGHTKRHHTFFEMLGNFSFGGYFKEEAIKLAWDLLNEFQIDKKKLIITTYYNDDESYNLWKKIANFNDDKIIKIKTNDNFWSMGNLGPCGPCSEIFYDYGSHVSGGLPGSAEQDGDRYVEIWNLVFMQYEKTVDGLIDLPIKCIDTGAGLERLSSVIQGVTSNYETDFFAKLIEEIKIQVINNKNINLNYCYKVIADHIRAIVFLIADNVMPSNEAHGYVLRRIIRRATWHANVLGSVSPSMHKILPFLFNTYSHPNIIQQKNYIEQILHDEEDRFLHLINKGRVIIGNICNEQITLNTQKNIQLLQNNIKKSETNCNSDQKNCNSDQNIIDKITNNIINNAKEQPNITLDAKTSFMLYDTYGFPIDLIKNVLLTYNIEFNELEFHAEMQKQKEMGKNSWIGASNKSGNSSQNMLLLISDKYKEALINCEKNILEKIQPTNFIGYDQVKCSSYIVAILYKNELVKSLKLNQNDYVWLIFESTVFYGESGGQAGDIGYIKINNHHIEVLDTKKVDNLHLHLVLLHKNIEIQVANLSFMRINTQYRNEIKNHHTATHLLHASLQRFLGSHVTQKGSFVGSDILRFDFNSNTPLESSIIKKIEANINNIIFDRCEVLTQIQTKEEAKQEGALSLFNDKYTDVVRVIKVVNNNQKSEVRYHSLELCGGTHVSNTNEIGLFKIISEKGIASGIRRIEAKCGKSAYEYLNKAYETLEQVEVLLNTKTEVTDKFMQLIESNKQMSKDILQLKLDIFSIKSEYKQEISNNLTLYVENIKEDMQFTKKLLDHNLQKNQNQKLIICYVNNSKFIISKTKEVTISIKTIINNLFAKTKKGKGGGNDVNFQGDFEETIKIESIKNRLAEEIQLCLK